MSFRFYPQHDRMDCGPACLRMIASVYGRKYTLDYFRNISYITREGVSLLGITEAAKKTGFDCISVKLDVDSLYTKSHPCILHWNQNHFVVLRKISTHFFSKKKRFHIADPAHGFIILNEEKFKEHWSSDNNIGVALFLVPNKKFYELTPPKEKDLGIRFLYKYLRPYQKQLVLMFIMLLLGSGITLIFPFLTQKLIDKGVNGKNFNLVVLLLLSQLSLFLGTITIEAIRNWLMLYMGTKLSISIISDFLKKTLQLPIKFFDTKMMGDFNQRIQDNERIETFLTSQSLLTFFSMITFIVFFAVLWYYDFKILLVYISLTIASIIWSFYWLKKRKILDYFKFQEKGKNQESIYEIIGGVTEMKLNQFEDYKRKEWEKIQQNLFSLNIRALKIDQIQLSGFEFVNQLKNIIVTFLSAILVIKGKMTIGELLSVSYIVGQMNSPVNQLVQFFRSLQDAKLSLERLNEVQNYAPEEVLEPLSVDQVNGSKRGIELHNVSFQYEGSNSPYVLKNINMFIPEGKVTAIVGASGSGKTTLMKLLLKFYEPTEGNITFNSIPIDKISAKSIRENSGVVMQDGFIFSDSIRRNVTTADENTTDEKFNKAIKIANIDGFINSLPLKSNTKIGASGNGISGGQKQRILIARAVYKDPHYILFDEATSALDSDNEKIIHNNLQEFFKRKTVLIIAHRLSTVKNAHQIIVLKNGEIVDYGTHDELVKNKTYYYHLVKNQLELGN